MNKDIKRWITRINVMKMTTLLKTTCRFNTIPIEIPMVLFTEIEKYLKIHMGAQKFIDNQNNSE